MNESAPEYWSGYVFGQEPSPRTVALGCVSLRILFKEAKLTEEAYKRSGVIGMCPAEIDELPEISCGETMNADTYPLGTSFLMDHEMLIQRRATSCEAPFNPIGPDILWSHSELYDGPIYESRRLYSVVMAGKRGKYFGSALLRGTGQYVADYLPTQFTIGEVMGESVSPKRAGLTSPHHFQRITAVKPLPLPLPQPI